MRRKKEPAASYSRTGESRTTLGDGALDFRVRNGNGYDNSSMATGKTDFASRNQMQISNLKSQISSGDLRSSGNLRCLQVIQDVLRSDPHDCEASWELKRITTRTRDARDDLTFSEVRLQLRSRPAFPPEI